MATISAGSSPTALYRVDRFRTLNITADADKKRLILKLLNVNLKRSWMRSWFATLIFPYELEGEAKEQAETLWQR